MNALMVNNHSLTRAFNKKAIDNCFQLYKLLLLQLETLSSLIASYSVTCVTHTRGLQASGREGTTAPV